MDIPANSFEGDDLKSFLSFFSDFTGRMEGLPVAIEAFGDRQAGIGAREVASQVLPLVHAVHPDFPFQTVFDAWSDEEDEQQHREAVQSIVAELAARM